MEDIHICKQFSELGEVVSIRLAYYKELVQSLNIKIVQLSDENSNYKNAYEAKAAMVDDLTDEIRTLKNNVKKLEDDNAAFSKVSHIIAMEKENAKLKSDIQLLTHRCNILSKRNINIPAPQPEQPQTEPKNVIPSQEHMEHEETFIEKKIKGIIYYISEDKQYIYEKLEDGDVGKKLGHLEKKNDKVKAIWD